jgi:hypothetical protein
MTARTDEHPYGCRSCNVCMMWLVLHGHRPPDLPRLISPVMDDQPPAVKPTQKPKPVIAGLFEGAE